MAMNKVIIHDVVMVSTIICVTRVIISQDVQEKAREEAIRVLGDNPEDVVPNSEQVKSLPYIDMIIKEVCNIPLAEKKATCSNAYIYTPLYVS